MRIWLYFLLFILMGLPNSCMEKPSKITRDDLLLSVANRMSDFRDFLTVEQLETFLNQIAKQYPSQIKLTTLATAPDGSPIYELQVGDGSHHALIYAYSTPQEAMGSMMLVYLIRELVTNQLLRKHYDVTWHVVLCAAPDQAKLAEKAYKQPLSLSNFIRHSYLPPQDQQVMWTFPVSQDGYTFDKPLQGAVALMNIIDNSPIEVAVGLHNSIFGSAFYTFSDSVAELYPLLYQFVDIQGFPLDDKFRRQQHVKGIYPADSVKELIEVAKARGFGASFADYLKSKRPDAWAATSSLPQFQDPRLNNHELGGIEDKQLLNTAMLNQQASVAFVTAEYEITKGLITKPSPFTGALEAILKQIADSPTVAADTDTVGELTAKMIDQHLKEMMALSQYIRLLEGEKDQVAILPPALAQSLEKSLTQYEKAAKRAETDIHYSVMSIQRVARVQLLAVLYVLDQLQINTQKKDNPTPRT